MRRFLAGYIALRWTVVALGLLGHVAFFLAAFNRVNAVGWKRTTIKRCEKGIVLCCILIPIAIIALAPEAWRQFLFTDQTLPTSSLFRGELCYVILSLVCLLAMLPGWLAARFHLIPKKRILISSRTEKWLVQKETEESPFSSKAFAWMGSLPGNEIGSLEVSHKCLSIPFLPKPWHGFRIGHISDLHLTGGMSHRFYDFAFEQIQATLPEIFIISGDIIDYDHQLPLLAKIIKKLNAPLGCYFVLGNHDRRLKKVAELRSLLYDSQWTDISQEPAMIETDRGNLWLAGNELPWFQPACQAWVPCNVPAKPPENSQGNPERSPFDESSFRLAVAHSPDQFTWAARLKAHLLLCGHTHGGQIRLPILGPIVAPSWHGSRFASGVFQIDQTVMHVSRGLSGVHPIRWRCLPELTCIHVGNEDS